MTVISTQELARDPLGVLGRVEKGESLVVTKDGQPVAEMRPTKAADSTPRPRGLAQGEFTVPKEFFDPLPEDILRGFEGS